MLEQRFYVVARGGVYMQGIGGVFDDVDKAIAAAEQLAHAEPDSHHHFMVFELPLNAVGEVRDSVWPQDRIRRGPGEGIVAFVVREDPEGWSRFSTAAENAPLKDQVKITVKRVSA